MRKLFCAILLMFFGSTNGQNATSKKKIIDALSNEKIWTSCNIDHQFYKNDTINFYSSRTFEYCKKYISWEFIDNKTFKEVKGEDFGNHQGIDIVTDTDFYKFKLKEFDNDVIVEIWNSTKIKRKFKVIEMQYLKNNIQKITIVKIL